MAKQTYNKGNMPKVWELMVKLHKENPEAFTSPEYLKAIAGQTWKSLNDKEHCPNCKGSMVSYWFEFDVPNASMLTHMANRVSENKRKGMTFNEANQIHVQSMNGPTYAMKSRTTQMAKLGLIAKVKRDGKHVGGTWLITARGWDALAGQPVPKRVESFQNEIISRDDEMITMKQVFQNWSNKKAELQKKGKTVKNDYTDEVKLYIDNLEEWVHYGQPQQGGMI